MRTAVGLNWIQAWRSIHVSGLKKWKKIEDWWWIKIFEIFEVEIKLGDWNSALRGKASFKYK